MNPYALVTPETSVKDGQELKPLAKSSTPVSDLSKAPGLTAAFAQEVASPALSTLETTLYQVWLNTC